jgi:hypothetical protein
LVHKGRRNDICERCASCLGSGTVVTDGKVMNDDMLFYRASVDQAPLRLRRPPK